MPQWTLSSSPLGAVFAVGEPEHPPEVLRDRLVLAASDRSRGVDLHDPLGDVTCLSMAVSSANAEARRA
eukprot:3273047-Pyramimonas_sp.AAC.1